MNEILAESNKIISKNEINITEILANRLWAIFAIFKRDWANFLADTHFAIHTRNQGLERQISPVL